MKRQNWVQFSRYFLVGLLVSGMAMDQAAARRLFRRGCSKTCAEVCPPKCPSPEDISTCSCQDSAVVDDSQCVEEAVFVDSACLGCAAEAHPEIVTEELFLPVPTPSESHVPPSESHVPIEAIESPFAPPSYQPVSPPAQLAVPEMSDSPVTDVASPSTPDPAPVEPPATEVVGDRYSGGDDLFGPPVKEISSIPNNIEPPAADKGTKDQFDEPIAPAEEGDSSDAPLPEPAPEEPPTEDPAPQPDMDDDDLFGQVEPDETAELALVDEPDDVTEERRYSTTPAPSEPEPEEEEEPETTEETDEVFDLFGEGQASLKEQSVILARAGGLQSGADRNWTDNTATHQCKARLVGATANNVVLLRSTGAKLVVPLTRLGDDDLQFVYQQITALRIVQAREAAAEKLAVAWAR